jgi:hypothetical protein
MWRASPTICLVNRVAVSVVNVLFIDPRMLAPKVSHRKPALPKYYKRVYEFKYVTERQKSGSIKSYLFHRKDHRNLLHTVNIIESINRTMTIILETLHRLQFLSERFGNWICIRHRMQWRKDFSIQLGPSERAPYIS